MEAAAAVLKNTYWMPTRLIMMYHQVVMLGFFNRTDGGQGLIKWPHVSINTMERIAAIAPPTLENTKDVL